MAYTITNPISGLLPIAATDAGFTPPGSSTVIPTPPLTLGMIVQATDPVFGAGEFILLPGVGSLTIGSMVVYNATTLVTTLSPNTAGIGSAFAWAMAANTSASVYSWFQIAGLVVAKKTAVSFTPQVAVYQSATTGRVMSTVASGKQVVGARSANLTTVTSTTSTVILQVNRPHNTGVII